MAFSSGARRDLYYRAESSFGVFDAGNMTQLRNTDDSLSLTRDSVVSDERRGDRGIHDVRLGNKQPGGDIGFEFSYASFEDFMSAALFANWGTGSPYDSGVGGLGHGSGLTVEVTVAATAGTVTRASGSWLSDGVYPGDAITFSEFVNAGNNNEFYVRSVTPTVITLYDPDDLLVDEVLASGLKATTSAREIRKGTIKKFFSIEKGFADIGQYWLFLGSMVNTFNLSITPNAMVTGTFGLVCRDMTKSTSSSKGTPIVANSNRPFDAFTGKIFEGGSTISIVSSLDMTLDNGLERNFALMADTAPNITSGKSNITGNMSLYFEDDAVFTKFANETESAIAWRLTDDENNGYYFHLPRIKYTTGDAPVNADGAIMVSMAWQALDDPTELTNIIIRKQPAVV